MEKSNRDFFRSTLFHFQLSEPGILAYNGEEKLNPAFVVYMKERGIDYRYIEKDVFIYAVLQMLQTCTVQTDTVLQDANDYISTAWLRYIASIDQYNETVH